MTDIRHDWSKAEAEALLALPLNDLLFRAATLHRAHFDANAVQVSQLCSIKTGGCPEDCNYCSQSAKFETEVSASKLMEIEAVLNDARAAKAAGASRFCMGAAWRNPKPHQLDAVADMVRGVKAMGLETFGDLQHKMNNVLGVMTSIIGAAGTAVSFFLRAMAFFLGIWATLKLAMLGVARAILGIVELAAHIPGGPDDDTVAPRWRGIGIRIEDDVLVTEQGPQVLTAGVPKEVDELEALIQGIPSLGD